MMGVAMKKLLHEESSLRRVKSQGERGGNVGMDIRESETRGPPGQTPVGGGGGCKQLRRERAEFYHLDAEHEFPRSWG